FLKGVFGKEIAETLKLSLLRNFCLHLYRNSLSYETLSLSLSLGFPFEKLAPPKSPFFTVVCCYLSFSFETLVPPFETLTPPSKSSLFVGGWAHLFFTRSHLSLSAIEVMGGSLA
ncbi:hypothetical protein V8G54_034832, partial [Vigna mungo]